MRIKTIACTGVLLAASMPMLSLAQTASLEETIEKAILTNPEVRVMFNDFQSALEGKNVKFGELLPEVTAQGWTGREWRGHSPEGRSGNWTRTGYSLQLRQLLFDGFSTYNDVKQLGFEKLSSYFELLSTVDSLAAQATEAYLDVQRYREMEQLAHENYGVHKHTLSQLRERQQSGVGRGVDLEQANGRVALAQTNLMTESGNLNDVIQRYRRVVGELPPETLLGAPEVGDKVSAELDKVHSVIKGNPSVLSKQALVQAADAGVSSAKGNHAPTLEFRASTGRDKSQPNYRDAHASRAELVLSYNLFRGGSDQARVRQTKAQHYAARDVRDYTCRNVQQDLSVAWNNIQRIRSQIPYLQEHEQATARVRVAYMQQFQIGERSLLDVLDTENELFDSRRSLTNALYDLKQAEFKWLSLAHELIPAVYLEQPFSEAPDEIKELDLPDEVLDICMTPKPDVTNLTPVDMKYSNDGTPPVIRQTLP